MPENISFDRPRIILLVGLPGSGKSTYLEKLGVSSLSSDEMRRLLIDDVTNQTIHARVFAAIRYMLRQRIQLKRRVTYIDATNLRREDREPFLRMGRLYNCPVEALFLDVPLDVCKERNRQRGRLVPEAAMDSMAAKLVAPTPEEGFAKVTRLEGLAIGVEQPPKAGPE